MKVKVLTDIKDLDIAKEEWDDLVSENETNTIFQTYEWFKCWWAVYGPENDLYFLCAYDDQGQLLGFAPLAINATLYGDKHLIFVGDGNADYLDFVIPRQKYQVLNAFFIEIKKTRNLWKKIALRNVPQHSSTMGLLNSLSSNLGVHCRIAGTVPCPTLIVNNRTQHVKRIANKYSTKRPYNYFKRTGCISHKIINDVNTIDNYLEPFFSQHIDRWRNTKTQSLFLMNKNKEFYRLLARALIPNGYLLFSIVYHNNAPITYHYGFDYNSVVTWYKPSFAIEHSRHSPGTLMIRFLIKYCLDNKKHELDFTVGDESYKHRFDNMIRYNYNLRVFTNTATSVLFYVSQKIKNLIKFLVFKRR